MTTAHYLNLQGKDYIKVLLSSGESFTLTLNEATQLMEALINEINPPKVDPTQIIGSKERKLAMEMESRLLQIVMGKTSNPKV